MKLIVTQNKNEAKSIIGALGGWKYCRTGYFENDLYQVVWMGEYYEISESIHSNLFDIPDDITYCFSGKSEQLDIIKKLANRADEIICATPANRDGEFSFRMLAKQLGFTKPIKRLWLSSLAAKDIQQSIKLLKSCSAYDNFYFSAKARREADWFMGLHLTRALKQAINDTKNISLGRIQAPTLALICKRYNEVQAYQPTTSYTCKVTLKAADTLFVAHCNQHFATQAEAQQYMLSLRDSLQYMQKTEEEEKEPSPLPFNLTALQVAANKELGFSVEETENALEKLYLEHNMITYPWTDCAYLPKNQKFELSTSAKQLKNISKDAAFQESMNYIAERSSNAAAFKEGLMEHHAIIPTFLHVDCFHTPNLPVECKKIYELICKQFLMALLLPCKRNKVTMLFKHDNGEFTTSFTVIKRDNPTYKDWRELADAPIEMEENQLLKLGINESCIITNFEIQEHVTTRPALYSEIDLFNEMQSVGQGVGLGTTNSRKNALQKMYDNEYVVKKDDKLVPTEKGLRVYDIIKESNVSSIDLTFQWEQKLEMIADGNLDVKDFYKEIVAFTQAEVQRIFPQEKVCVCPSCGGVLEDRENKWSCNQCNFFVAKNIKGKEISEDILNEIITHGESRIIDGFISAAGNPFSAKLKLEGNAVKFVFNN
ncbi:MAG: DNA topoisomerase [Paludibacteraceae bacterium]|nr:DNA topoisomerase [Paludibacteraceae bacterium]